MCLVRARLLILILFLTIICIAQTRTVGNKVKRHFIVTESDELDLEDFIIIAVSSPQFCPKGVRPDKHGHCRRVLESQKKNDNNLALKETEDEIFRCKSGYRVDYKGICRRIFQRK